VKGIDAPEMLEKLHSIKKAILLLSNPCFELWYILHYSTLVSRLIIKMFFEKFDNQLFVAIFLA